MKKKKNLKWLWPTAFYVPTVIDVGAPWYLSGGVAAANCLAAYKAIGAADIATSYVNLAKPGTYDLTTSDAPTFAAATGWTFNGTSQFLDTGVVPATGYSVQIRFTDCENVTNASMFGQVKTNANFYLVPPGDGGGNVKYYSGRGVAAAPQMLSGIMGMAGQQGYRNGVPDGAAMASWLDTATLSCYIGAYNTAGGPNWLYVPTSKIQACAIYNTILTDAQMLAVSNAMAAL